ncbi:alpha/beta fold hydrolase [Mesorhizobium sp. M2C.T.Ca.TU.009.01.2.1]|nr:alpha/beta fold hydrolase [Mesorhizobium sp. M2C.T.Ca.TU.009.01.2.1]
MRYSPSFARSSGLIPVLVVLAVLALVPLLSSSMYLRHLLVLAFVFGIVASSWDLSLGYGGLFNFAHVALFTIGTYAFGLVGQTLGLSPWLGIAFAGVAAGLVAALITLPILRLSGIYIILVTIAASQVLYQIIISQSDIAGGTSGMVSLPALELFGYRFNRGGKVGYYYLALLMLVASTIILYKITRSRFGRAIVAMRDHKYYAISRGMSETRTRLFTLTVSAALSGVAGGFYGSYMRVASPDNFGLGLLGLLLSMLLLGGAGTIWGPILAAFFVTMVSEVFAAYGAWRNIIMSLLLIVILIFYPGGLWALLQTLREALDVVRSQATARLRRRFGLGQREAMTGAHETMVATRHGRIAVADTGGDKPALLLIHGNSSAKEVFANQFKALRDRYRVISFDLPGHGVSDNADPEKDYSVEAFADVAEDVLKALGAANPFVFGWSLGGYIAIELAARGYPVRALAVSGTPPLRVVPEDVGRAYDATSHFVLASKTFLSPAESRDFAASTTGPKTVETIHLHRAVRRTDGRARAYTLGKLQIVDWPRQMRFLRSTAVPFAILNGSNDPFLNHQYFRDLKLEQWTGEPDDIQDGKHAPFLLKPAIFNEKLVAFLRAAETTSRHGADVVA